MATTNTVTGDQVVNGSLTVSGGISGQSRTGLATDTSQVYELPFQTFRIWDEFERPLPNIGVSSGLVVANYRWEPNGADDTFFIADHDYRVVGITARVEVAGTDGSAVTLAVKKAASGTDIASGTALHSGTANLKGTVDTNQVLTLSTTISALYVPSGTAIGVDLTGTMTAARGVVSVYMVPISADDLSITAGVYGTGLPYISTGDVKALGAQTQYARTMFTLPPEYVAGTTVTFRAAGGMLTNVSDTTATVAFEAYKSARTTLKTGSNLVSTTAQTINSLTFAEKNFDLSSGGLVAGDVLDVRVAIAVSDTATVTAVIGAIAHAEALLTIKG